MACSTRLSSECSRFHDPLHGKTQTGQSLLKVFGKPPQIMDRRFLRMAERAGNVSTKSLPSGRKENNMNRQKAISLLLLLIESAVTLFIAGLLVPSLVRSDLATKEALAAGSLHIINIAGIAFSYTTQNVVFAILGALVGAMATFAIHSNTADPQRRRPYPLFRRCHSRGTFFTSLVARKE